MTTRDAVLDALHDVIDPEVGIDIVELGLVYGVEVEGDAVRVAMTMTSPACPLGEALTDDARRAILAHAPDTHHVDVSLVWSPPWSPDRMSHAARKALGWGG